MNYTILGANGFLSDAIARHCNECGRSLSMYGLAKPTEVECDHFGVLDLTKEEPDIEELLHADIIVYAIGAGIQSNLQEGNELIYHLNVSAPVKICNQLRKKGYQGIFVTLGSYFEMGETLLRRPFTEQDVLLSTSPAPNDYTVSKRMLSRFVSSYTPTFRHWHLYLPTIYGMGENPKRLIPYTINAIQKGETLHFTAGDQVRQYVHVSEVPLILDAASKQHLPTGIYNVPGKETISVRQLVTLIHQQLRASLPDDCFDSAQRADTGMKYLSLDGSKLKQLTGYLPKRTIAETLSSYLS